MQLLNDAYAILSDPKKREGYDNSRYDTDKSNSSVVSDEPTKTDSSSVFVDIFNDWMNDSQWTKPQNQQAADFSEVAALREQIEEYQVILKTLESEIRECTLAIQNEKNKISTEIAELRQRTTAEEGYKQAIGYIEKIKKKDSSRIFSLTITRKQQDLYQNCVELIEKVEEQLQDRKNQSIRERVEPLEQRKKSQEEEYWSVDRKKRSLEHLYNMHPLKAQYEESKKKQEETSGKKR